jgi:putative FmdB family regulatory protein
MPTYEYACDKCGHEFEAEQRITDDPLKSCPACRGRKVRRLISRTSFVLKGGGWYSDLYSSRSSPAVSDAKGGDSDAASSAKGGDSDAASSAKGGDSDAASKPAEAKPAAAKSDSPKSEKPRKKSPKAAA